MGRPTTGLLVVIVLVVDCSTMNIINEIEEFSDFLKKTSVLDQNLKAGPTTGQSEEDDVISDHAWEDSGRFEGDIILNERQRRQIVEEVTEGLSRNGLRDSTKRWPDNEVIFYVQREHFTSDQVDAIKAGIDDLAQASCIKFRPYRKGDRDAVVIQGSRRGCFSQVGYQGGYQVLNLSGRHPVGRGCFRHGTVVHELLHTLGFFHMQSSPDRDDYIHVAWENIIPQTRHNFKKYNTFSVSDFGVGYDYESVLHYSRRAFSINGRDTLIPKENGAEIGQRVGLSDKDVKKLNKMYCDAGSNSFDADPAPKIERTPKSSSKHKKNKPFQGHGIGYHKGKTVIIKLPAAETVYLSDRPTFDSFNYFSQSPKAVLPTNSEGFGITQEITPLGPVLQGYTPLFRDSKPNKSRPKDEVEINRPQDNIELHEERTVSSENNGNEVSTPTPTPTAATDYENTFINKDFTKAFGALEKILKTHYQPTPKPDDANKDFNGFFESKRLTPKSYKDKADELLASLDDINIKEKKTEIINTEEKVVQADEQHKSSHEYDKSYGTSLPSILNQPNVIKIFDPIHKNNNDVNRLHSQVSERSGAGRQPYILLGALVPLTEDFYKQNDQSKELQPQNISSTESYEDFSTTFIKETTKEEKVDDHEKIYDKDDFYKPYAAPYDHYDDIYDHHPGHHAYTEYTKNPEKETNTNTDILKKDMDTPVFDISKYNDFAQEYIPYETLTENRTRNDTAQISQALNEFVPHEHYKISYPYDNEEKLNDYIPKYASIVQEPTAVYEVTENASPDGAENFDDSKFYFNSNMNDRLSRLLQQDNYDYYDIARPPVDHFPGNSRIVSKYSPRFTVQEDDGDAIYFYSR